jgi:Fe2+ transport system protein FeoA
MSELGLTPGVELEVFQRNDQGPLLIAVRDTRLAIGRGMADKVLVELVNPLAEIGNCRES